MQPIYKIKNLLYQYDKNPALKIKKLCIDKYSTIGLIGPNGSGKTTLLNIMAFLYPPIRGEIFFNGEKINSINKSIRLGISLLTQKPYLMKRTVYQNIIYGLKIRKVEKKYHNELARMALDMVGLGFEEFFDRKCYRLSGGEIQRVALAARLILKPRVLLMDEPTASVDSNSSQLIKKALINAREEWGTTLIITSHDHNWINSICNKVIFIYKGRLINGSNTNMIIGPWIKIDKNTFINQNHNERGIIVNRPNSEESIAIIDPSKVKVCYSIDDSNGNNQNIKGIIKQLKLEQKKEYISIQVDIGNSILTSTMRIEKFLTMKNIYPGKKIIISYSKEEIQWI